MRLLALDVGERRIGLASGVSELGTALPAGVFAAQTACPSTFKAYWTQPYSGSRRP